MILEKEADLEYRMMLLDYGQNQKITDIWNGDQRLWEFSGNAIMHHLLVSMSYLSRTLAHGSAFCSSQTLPKHWALPLGSIPALTTMATY